MAPSKLNLKIYKGSTFSTTLRWESSTRVYVPIQNISRSAPMVITAAGHGAVAGWRTRITNAGGIKEVNALDYIVATGVTQDTLTYNSVNSLSFTQYTSGGILEYNAPVNLSNYTARMQIREKLTSAEYVLELTTGNLGILLDNTTKTINLNIPAETTESLQIKTGVYSLELVNGDVVIPFVYGNVTVVEEVTR